MAELTDIAESRGRTYVCETCEVQFIVPQSETAVCCPICRMNRVSAVD